MGTTDKDEMNKKLHQRGRDGVAKIIKKVKKDGTVIVKEQSDARLERFLECFVENGGHGTKAAMQAFGITSRAYANNVANKYLKKAKGLGRIYLEKRGYGYGKLLEVAIDKMLESKDTDWWDRLMKISDYEDFTAKAQPTGQAVNVNIAPAHNAYSSRYVDADDADVIEPDKLEPETE